MTDILTVKDMKDFLNTLDPTYDKFQIWNLNYEGAKLELTSEIKLDVLNKIVWVSEYQ